LSGVEFRGVSKRFGDTVAVEHLDLTIQEGEFFVLLGPSGCGKSTALRMIAGLEDISEGQLLIGSEVVNDVPPKARDISMVFQSYALYPHMTVRKNIESPLRARGKVSDAEREELVQESARMLGLSEYLDRKPGALSGGQRQRVALARAVVRRPGVFLMDEPLSNLDAKLRTQTRLELVDLWRRLGTTFVYVTHDQVEAMTMATRIAVMSMGKLQQVGAPQEVYDRPANIFVAGFIGSPPMNMVMGEISGGTVACPIGSVPLATSGDQPPNPAIRTGSQVVAGIRPEHLTVGGNDLRAQVLAVELLGHERHLVCSVGDQRWTIRQESADAPVGVGDHVGLGVDAAHVHLFDAVTGDRLN
jgi:ABC-type sugar transport system ATPase subunit